MFIGYDYASYRNYQMFTELQNKYAALHGSASHKGSRESLSLQLLMKLCVLQRYRYQMAARMNRWDYLYAYCLNDLLQNQVPSSYFNIKAGQDEKKKFTTIKNQLVAKINKTLQDRASCIDGELEVAKKKGFCYREIKKVYAYCIEGSLESLVCILQSIRAHLERVVGAPNEKEVSADYAVLDTLFRLYYL